MSYSTIQDHQYMLFDDLRNTFYFKAIKNAVNKNSAVLDLGAGLGIHGFMANSCGAKKVYLVEPSPILDVTKMVVKDNTTTEKMECISGKIEKVSLPEQVDVIISVFTGNFLLTEDLLPSLFYARDKYLRPGGKMIPDRAKMIVVPVSATDYYTKHIDCWSKPTYSIDYSIARKYAVNSLYYDGPEKRKSDFLAEPTNLLDLNFMEANTAECQNIIDIEITVAGTIDGFLGWFDAHIGDKWLSTSPIENQTHWRQVFLPLNKPINVIKGEVISFELTRPEFGDWSWTIEHNNKRQKQSTFLSKPLKVKNLLKQTENYKGNLSQKGKATQDILQLLNGEYTTSEITLKILKRYTDLFTNRDQAYSFVKKIVEHYC